MDGMTGAIIDQVPGYPRREATEPARFSSQAGLSTFVVRAAEFEEVAA